MVSQYLKKKLVFQVNNTYQIENWNFDPVTGLNFGVGLNVPYPQRILVSLDGSSGTLKVVGTIPHHLYLDGSVSTIDSKNGLIYVILDNALVSSSVTKAGTVGSVGLDCDMEFDCPLNLGYYEGGSN